MEPLAAPPADDDPATADDRRTEVALELADWRRKIHALYAQVRAVHDPEAGHAIWRAGRDELFATHPQSPLLADDALRTQGVPYWPYDASLRWTLQLEPSASSSRRSVSTGATEVTNMRHLGWVTLPAPVNARLAVWWLEQYGGGIFVPVRDATAGDSSYGGGRYLLDTAKGADLGGSDAEIIVDLNFLFHPSCRYDPQWICPLAPAENTIAAAVEAGERLP